MKITVIAVTRDGVELAQKVSRCLTRAGHQVRTYRPAHLPGEGTPYEQPLSLLVGREFSLCQGMVLIMALGIAVRVLAPLLRSKVSDPGVVVMDEKGNFAISLLGGHLGGANQLAREVAAATGAVPVITTATEVKGLLAVDLLALRYNLAIESMEGAKRVNASLVNGEEVYIASEYPLPLPEEGYKIISFGEAVRAKLAGWLVLITNRALNPPSSKILFLRPRNLVAGIGCRKGAKAAALRSALYRALSLAGRSAASLRALATIERRGEEEGLQEVARSLDIPLLVFTAEEINDLMEKFPQLSRSPFVKERVGVEGVCEPTALLAAPEGRLILSKTAIEGVTVALVEESYGWWERDREIQHI